MVTFDTEERKDVGVGDLGANLMVTFILSFREESGTMILLSSESLEAAVTWGDYCSRICPHTTTYYPSTPPPPRPAPCCRY